MNFKNICTEMIRSSNQNLGREARIKTNFRFEFLGVSSKERRQICHQYHKQDFEEDLPLDRKFLMICWRQNYREFQYIALDYLVIFKHKLLPEDFKLLAKMIAHRPWWDTNTVLYKLLGFMMLKYPFLLDEMLSYIDDTNDWLRAMTLLYQIDYGAKCNLAIFDMALRSCMTEGGRVAQRSVIRALLNYASFNPYWVRDFIEANVNDIPDVLLPEIYYLFSGLGTKNLDALVESKRKDGSFDESAFMMSFSGAGVYAVQSRFFTSDKTPGAAKASGAGSGASGASGTSGASSASGASLSTDASRNAATPGAIGASAKASAKPLGKNSKAGAAEAKKAAVEGAADSGVSKNSGVSGIAGEIKGSKEIKDSRGKAPAGFVSEESAIGKAEIGVIGGTGSSKAASKKAEITGGKVAAKSKSGKSKDQASKIKNKKSGAKTNPIAMGDYDSIPEEFRPVQPSLGKGEAAELFLKLSKIPEYVYNEDLDYREEHERLFPNEEEQRKKAQNSQEAERRKRPNYEEQYGIGANDGFD